MLSELAVHATDPQLLRILIVAYPPSQLPLTDTLLLIQGKRAPNSTSVRDYYSRAPYSWPSKPVTSVNVRLCSISDIAMH